MHCPNILTLLGRVPVNGGVGDSMHGLWCCWSYHSCVYCIFVFSVKFRLSVSLEVFCPFPLYTLWQSRCCTYRELCISNRQRITPTLIDCGLILTSWSKYGPHSWTAWSPCTISHFSYAVKCLLSLHYFLLISLYTLTLSYYKYMPYAAQIYFLTAPTHYIVYVHPSAVAYCIVLLILSQCMKLLHCMYCQLKGHYNLKHSYPSIAFGIFSFFVQLFLIFVYL